MPLPSNKLQSIWNKKLAKSGFIDIEDSSGRLKFCDSDRFHHPKVVSSYETKREYFRMAGHFLHDYVFTSRKERKIWEMHSNAVSYRNIALSLIEGGIKSNKDHVHGVISKLNKIMFKLYGDAAV